MDYRCRLVRKFIHCFWEQRPLGKICLSYSFGLRDFIFRARFTSFRAHASRSYLPLFLIFFLLFLCASVWETTLARVPHFLAIAILNGSLPFPTVQLHVHIQSIRCESRNTDALVNQLFQTNQPIYDDKWQICILLIK